MMVTLLITDLYMFHLFSLLLFLLSVVKLNGLTALELTWVRNYGELTGALKGINTNSFFKKITEIK